MDDTFLLSANYDITKPALIVVFVLILFILSLNHYLPHIPKTARKMDKEFESWLK